ncbi:hypothetical protein M407DRAFT_24220 [Tulasnella calospora MUT 4182]|uniref:HTH APSES-type domain-containing protein n=1 Tax=Tulasnella calospora MUT 4182 TaxID=1051891 RepID=A0A0C3QJS5_9AGAM|nr:hypothetical protein M407DRAFT_24220 [Tulasnella calospora MUT 4182]
MSASTAATPVPVHTPAPAPAAPGSTAPVSKPPTPAGGTLTPIAVAPPSSNGARVYNAIYSSVQVYECMVRGIAVMRRRVDSYVNATQILKVAGIDKGRRTKILEKEILPGRHEIVQGGYGKYQGTWIPLERGREVATQFGVLPLLQPLFDYVPPTATMPSMVGLRPPPTLFYPPGTTFPAYSLGAQALQLTYPPAPGAALSILQQGRSAGLFTPTATFSALPPGFQFSHMGYGIPTTLPGQPSQQSIISVTPTPKGAIAEVRPGSVTPSVTTPALRPSPAPSTAKESQAGQKRPRSAEGAQDAKMATAAPKAAKAKKAPTVSRAGSSAAIPAPNDDRASKRQRLESQRSDAMDLTTDDTLPASSQQASDNQGTIFGSQATIPDSQASLDPGPSSPPLPVVEPNGIHPLPLTVLTLSKPITDLPDAKARVSTKPPQRTRPLGPGDSEPPSPLKSPQYRAILLAIVSDEPAPSIIEQISAASLAEGAVDVNLVIDDQGHTALHWAASMARLSILEALVASGADVHRGNFAGETPLIRAILSTNPHESHSFAEILTALLPSLRTVDNKSQSVLHHIAHVAGVKGRAAAARYYLETVLEFVVRHQEELGGTEELVDLQDVHGDTALNISARVGNRALVRMLIDVGANRILANKLGLRPGDFGVENENLQVPVADDYIAALRTGPSPPVQKSQDVIAELTDMINNLASEFSAEVAVKQKDLDLVQVELRNATRQLAEQRKQIQECQNKLSQLDQVHQRIQNVERVLKEEDTFDWTGRSTVDGKPEMNAGKPFQHRGPQSVLGPLTAKTTSAELPPNSEPDPAFPPSGALGGNSDTVATWMRLKRMKMWHGRMDDLMEQRIEGSKGASAEKELQCRKVVSLCTGVAVDEVDGMLENLVIAMESDGQVVDLTRVAGFMQKVKTA